MPDDGRVVQVRQDGRLCMCGRWRTRLSCGAAGSESMASAEPRWKGQIPNGLRAQLRHGLHISSPLRAAFLSSSGMPVKFICLITHSSPLRGVKCGIRWGQSSARSNVLIGHLRRRCVLRMPALHAITHDATIFARTAVPKDPEPIFLICNM